MADSIQVKYEEVGLDESIQALKDLSKAAKDTSEDLKDLNKDLKDISRSSRSAARGIDKLSDSLTKSILPLTSAVGLTRLLKENLNAIGNTWDGVPGMGGRGRGGGGGFGGGGSGYGPRGKTYNAEPRGGYPQGKNHEFADLDRAAARDQELLSGFDDAFKNDLAKASMIFKDRAKVKDPKQYGLGSALKDLINTTRIGFGANGLEVAPLVGRSIAVAEKLVAGGGAALGGAMSAAAAVVYGVSKAIERNIVISRLATGSSLNQADQAYHAAQAFGMDPNQIGRSDMGIHEPGTRGWYYSIKAGIQPYRNPYTGQGYNDPENAMKEMRQILTDKSLSPGQRKAAAKEYGMEDLLPMYNLSDSEKDRLLNQKGREYSPENQRNLAETQKDINDAKSDWADFWSGVGGFFAGAYKNVKNMDFYAEGYGGGYGEGEPTGVFAPPGSNKSKKNAILNMNDKSDADKARDAQAMDKHTEAMNRHSDALNKNLMNWPGSFGSGGPRTNAAIPKGWGTQQWWNDAYDATTNHKIRMAGF